MISIMCSIAIPQFEPTRSAPAAASCSAAPAGVIPIIVKKPRGPLSNVIVATTGKPETSLAARMANVHSARSLIVSTQNASTPPAARPRACSANTSYISASVAVPLGSRNSPVGPIEPSTKRPGGATERASSAPNRLSSSTRSPNPYLASM